MHPSSTGKFTVPASIAGIASGLAVLGVFMAAMAVLSRQCAGLGAVFGVFYGGIPAIVVGLVTAIVIGLRRRNGEVVNGIILTRTCWGIVVVSALVVTCAIVFAPPATGTDCAL